LIEHASEQAFFNKFETMKKYFYAAAALRMSREIQMFPFSEEVTDEAYEGQWVIVKNGKEITIN
jgi:hypothetical protein